MDKKFANSMIYGSRAANRIGSFDNISSRVNESREEKKREYVREVNEVIANSLKR